MARRSASRSECRRRPRRSSSSSSRSRAPLASSEGRLVALSIRPGRLHDVVEPTEDSTRGDEQMAVKDVAVVSVPVSDQERAKAFYVDKLGLDLVSEDDSVPG